MHPYVLVLMVGAILSALHAGVVAGRQAPRRTNQLAAMLIFCGSIWASIQVCWNLAPDPETALTYMRLSGLGWVGIAPLALHLHLNLHPGDAPWARKALGWIYAASAVFVLVDIFTPWIHVEAVPTSWGYSYRLGWAFLVGFGILLATVGAAIYYGARNIRSIRSDAERHQMRWLVASLAVPIVAGSLTDGMLPFFDIHPPHLGSISILALGITTAWSFQRYGYSIMVPHDFASEILASLSEGVALVHFDGTIRSVNRGLAALAGAPARDLEGVRIATLLPQLDLEAVREGASDLPCKLVVRTGESVPVAVSVNPLHDKNGRDLALVILVRDQRELVSLRSHLVTSGRLAAVGELAAGVAHEINNPLTYVRANLGILQQHWDLLQQSQDPEEKRSQDLVREGEELIEESLEGVDRAVSIVRDIKGLAHAGRGELETIDLNPLLETVLRVTAPQLGELAHVEQDLAELPFVRAIPQELKQVFINVVLNAGHATRSGGRIRVQTRSEGGWVEVRIEDDGEGIPADILERIFDPFFTTKAVGDGTGLGLSISHEIVRKHGGEMSVLSGEGRGATFMVRLRAIEAAGPEPPPPIAGSTGPEAA